MVALLGERVGNEPDGRIAFFITPVQHLGSPGGLAGVKIFSTEDGVDLTNYVRKSGDTMTGGLSFRRPKGGTYTSISSMRPTGWDSNKVQFGMILDITDGNTYKHSLQFKARGYGSNSTTTLYKGYVDNTSGPNNIFQGKVKGDELYEAGERISTKKYTDQRYDQAKSHADTGDRKIREDLKPKLMT